MKKYIFLLLLAWLATTGSMAQSSNMTDTEVMKFIVEEHNRGTSNSQIVTKLMQQGVDISQIRRVRNKYERQAKQSGLGNLSDDASDKNNTRLRTNNGKRREDYGKNDESYMNMRIKAEADKAQRHTYDSYDEEFGAYQKELFDIIPDTAMLIKQLLKEKEEQRTKVFGRDIFNNKELSFEPNMNIATPQNYRLGPGDAVIIDIYGASQKSIEATVSPDGDIVIDGYGPIAVSGLTVAQANARLRSTVGSRYSSSKVKLTVGQTKTIMVNVMGEVKVPGTYTLSAFATVFHALYMAGGTNEIGTLRNIKVYRNNRMVTTVDIYDYILNGKLTGNVRLADNDVIVVGPYDCLVNVTGKVKRPMYYEMKKEESVSSLLKYAGGFMGDAYKKAVRLTRKTGREYAVFNVGEFDFSSFHIADGDSVSVDSILHRYQNTAEVKGAVFRPGKYHIGDQINSIRTLIEHAEGVTEEAFTSRAVMHRMKADRSLEVVSIDLEGIMSGKVADIALKENDVLFIPTKQEKTNQRTITIRGEVLYPGIYKYADNETIEDFVLQAGGLTDQASTMNVSVSRRITSPKALRPDSIKAQTFTLNLKDGFVVDGTPGFILMPYDEVYVRKSPAYSKQQNVSIEGEVLFAGTYALQKHNTRLSELFKMAGGANDVAYIKGARLMRKANETEKARMEAVLKMQREQQQKNILELAARSSGNVMQAAENAKNADLEKFSVPDEYPVGINLAEAIEHPGSDNDLILREGDRLIVPQYNSTVKINGAVMYANTVAFESGKPVSHYINQAGGYASDAYKRKSYIIYMNGKVAKVSSGAKVQPGCEIVVPAKIKRKMSMAETLSVGTSLSSIAAMIATIANLSK